MQDPSEHDALLGAPRARRRFSEPTHRGLRDVDSAARARLIRLASLSGTGGVLGYIGGSVLAYRVETPWLAFVLPFAGAVVMGGAVFLFALALVEGAGWAAGQVHLPSGSSTPRRTEHSHAEALAANGHFRDAVDAFERAAREHPSDPVPYLRAARLYRDGLDEPEEALRCFRDAREVSGIGEGQWRALTREMIDLLSGPIGQPVRAAPELARLSERAAGTPEGEWAARELAAVKRLIAPDL